MGTMALPDAGCSVSHASAVLHDCIVLCVQAGMATPDHTPQGRGYQQALHYFHHDNVRTQLKRSRSSHARQLTKTDIHSAFGPQDYWSMAYQLRCNGSVATDLWRTPLASSGQQQGPARGYNSTCVGHQPDGARQPGCDGGPEGDHWWGGYEDSLFEQYVTAAIDAHDASKSSLFVFWAPHIVRCHLLDACRLACNLSSLLLFVLPCWASSG
jgi:hypothetical protein